MTFFLYWIKFEIIFYYLINLNFFNFQWGLGIGDWGLGIGDWAMGPIPNPQSPIPIYKRSKIYYNIYNYFIKY